jgi:hypothetical protein
VIGVMQSLLIGVLLLLAAWGLNASGTADTGTTRIDGTDLAYLGAFKVPDGTIGPSSFAYGGYALAFRPDGDARGADDGFPGSLFLVGHPYEQMVAEIDIPAPVISPGKDANDLPRASILQPFADVTGGLAAQMADGDPRIGGLTILPPQGDQATPKLYWSVYRWYNVTGDNYLSHGWSELQLNAPDAQGGWRLGDYHNQMTAGYLLAAPGGWADAHLGGRRLLSGLNIQQGIATASQGPALFASAPWAHAVQPPPGGATLDALGLIYYPHTADASQDLPGHKISDEWEGAAWLAAGERQAVIVVGRISLGEYRYGPPLPGDCDQNQGNHGDPYQPAALFYDPGELAAAARGELDPWKVVPYARWNPEAFLFPTCEWFLTGAAFDAAHGLLYLVQPGADTKTNEFEPYPLVHVFRLAAEPSGSTWAGPYLPFLRR